MCSVCMGASKMSNEKRRRNIIWDEAHDAEAVRLASERGLFAGGGVSQLLAQLVAEEAANPRLRLQEPSPGYKAKIKGTQSQQQ